MNWLLLSIAAVSVSLITGDHHGNKNYGRGRDYSRGNNNRGRDPGQGTSQCPPCEFEDQPVCGINSQFDTFKTFPNQCQMQQFNCLNGNYDYEFQHNGACQISSYTTNGNTCPHVKCPQQQCPQSQQCRPKQGLTPVYLACNDVSPGMRSWSSPAILMPATISPWLCMDACEALSVDYTYFGMENNMYCRCGTTPERHLSTTNAHFNGCNHGCTGAPGYTCGGPNTQTTYQMLPRRQVGRDPSVGKYLGCFPVHQLDYAWPGRVKSSLVNTMTPAICQSMCSAHSFYAIEFASICSCGDIMPSGSSANLYCNAFCAGAYDRICGSRNGTHATVFYGKQAPGVAPPFPPPPPTDK